MRLNKLITQLQAFDKPRMKRFGEFIHSPYFKVPSSAKALFDYLENLHPTFDEKKLEPETIAKKVKELPTENKQAKAGTQLLQDSERFLSVDYFVQSPRQVTINLLQAQKALGLYEAYSGTIEELKEELNADIEKDIDCFNYKHIVTEIEFNGFDARMSRATRSNIMPVVKTLDEFYALKKLRYLCEAITRKQFLGIDVQYNEHHFTSLLKILEPYTNKEYPYVYLFVYVFKMLLTVTFEDNNIYYQLIKKMATHGNPSQAMREAMGYSVNCTLQWYNKGHDEAGDEYLWWIDWRKKNDLLLDDGQLMPVTFRNIITVGIGVGKDALWVKEIIRKYAPLLPAQHYETYFAFAQGLYHYVCKDYKKATQILLGIQTKQGTVFNCIIRLWHWKCLYEDDPNDTNLLYNHLHSYEKYLRRNKKEFENMSLSFDLFSVYAMKLIKVANNEMLQNYLVQLQNEEGFAGKNWLIQQYMAKNKKTVPMRHGLKM